MLKSHMQFSHMRDGGEHMKRWTVTVRQIGGKGGPQNVTVEAHDWNSAKRQAEHLYGVGNVSNVTESK